MKAEILINGPKGQAFTEVECDENGTIHPAFAEAALAHALNIYNELVPYRAVAIGKDDFVIERE